MVLWKWSFFIPKHDNESTGSMNIDDTPNEKIALDWQTWWPNVKQCPKLV